MFRITLYSLLLSWSFVNAYYCGFKTNNQLQYQKQNNFKIKYSSIIANNNMEKLYLSTELNLKPNEKFLRSISNNFKNFSSKLKKMHLWMYLQISALLFMFSESASAAVGSVKGWDLYGRVPNDDWLFSTWRLTDPNFFKRSLAETVSYYVYDKIYYIFTMFYHMVNYILYPKITNTISYIILILIIV